MSESDDPIAIVRALIAEAKKQIAEAEREESAITEISEKDREFVRLELCWIADYLKENYGFTYREINQKLREMLDVSV